MEAREEVKTGDIRYVDPKELEGKLQSKHDWYRFLKYSSKPINVLDLQLGGLYLPKYKKTTMRFIRDYLSGKKKLIKTENITLLNVPPYEELAVSKIFEQVKGDQRIMMHLNFYPDVKELPDHDFFYTVLGSLVPDYVGGLIRHANRVRNKRDYAGSQQKQIMMTQEIFEDINAEPYLSSKELLSLISYPHLLSLISYVQR